MPTTPKLLNESLHLPTPKFIKRSSELPTPKSFYPESLMVSPVVSTVRRGGLHSKNPKLAFEDPKLAFEDPKFAT